MDNTGSEIESVDISTPSARCYKNETASIDELFQKMVLQEEPERAVRRLASKCNETPDLDPSSIHEKERRVIEDLKSFLFTPETILEQSEYENSKFYQMCKRISKIPKMIKHDKFILLLILDAVVEFSEDENDTLVKEIFPDDEESGLLTSVGSTSDVFVLLWLMCLGPASLNPNLYLMYEVLKSSEHERSDVLEIVNVIMKLSKDASECPLAQTDKKLETLEDRELVSELKSLKDNADNSENLKDSNKSFLGTTDESSNFSHDNLLKHERFRNCSESVINKSTEMYATAKYSVKENRYQYNGKSSNPNLMKSDLYNSVSKIISEMPKLMKEEKVILSEIINNETTFSEDEKSRLLKMISSHSELSKEEKSYALQLIPTKDDVDYVLLLYLSRIDSKTPMWPEIMDLILNCPGDVDELFLFGMCYYMLKEMVNGNEQ